MVPHFNVIFCASGFARRPTQCPTTRLGKMTRELTPSINTPTPCFVSPPGAILIHCCIAHACPPACPPAHIPAHPHACLPLSVHVACLLGQVSITSTTLCHRSQQLSATQVIQDMGPYAGDNLSTQLAANLGFAVRLTLGRDLSQPHYLPMVLGYKASTVFLASPYLTTMEPPNLGSKRSVVL
jgi:hypothetical protein